MKSTRPQSRFSWKHRFALVALCVAIFGVAYWFSDDARPIVKDPRNAPALTWPAGAVMPKPDPKAAEERERLLREITEKQRQHALEVGSGPRVPPYLDGPDDSTPPASP